MKMRTILLVLAVCAITAAAWSVDNPQMGTWQLNEAKSKMAAGAPKVTKVIYEPSGNEIKSTVVTEDTDGKTTETVWVGKFDGKPYPVTGGAANTTRLYRVINARSQSYVQKEGKKVVTSGRIVVAPNGKSRTVISYASNAKGERVRSVGVYDKAM